MNVPELVKLNSSSIIKSGDNELYEDLNGGTGLKRMLSLGVKNEKRIIRGSSLPIEKKCSKISVGLQNSESKS